MKRTEVLPLMLCGIVLALAPEAVAKENGFPADSCSGCHRGGPSVKPRVTADPAKIGPGESTTLTIVIPGAAAGLYFSSNQKGSFTEIAGEGLKKAHETGVTHTFTKRGNGNEVTFKVKWTAPNTGPGGVDFDLSAVSANGDGSTRGDGDAFTRFNFSFGCDGVDVYLDQDGDGYGLTDLRGPTRQCELKTGWSLKPGDCNDYDKNANPMGTEICNLYDDDCDGMVNEDLDNIMVYKDEDGDGHGPRFNPMSRIGCGNGLGWSSLRDDCDDTDRMVHPRAKETCNYKDDNCNGRVDETVRPSCGTGWCRREASSCEMNAMCVPNPPRAEICNGFDDDCDDVVDNGATCTDSKVCYKGSCVSQGEAAMMMAAEPPKPPDAGAPRPDAGTAPPTGRPDDVDRPGTPSAGGGSGGGATSTPDEPTPRPGFGCQLGGAAPAGPGLLLALALMALRRRRR